MVAGRVDTKPASLGLLGFAWVQFREYHAPVIKT